MRFQILFLMLLSFLFFTGCSTDDQEGFFNTTSNSELSEDNDRLKKSIRPFKTRGEGTFQVVAPTECNDLTQVLIQGHGNATHLGLFEVIITYCTDFDLQHFITGTQIAANGDELYFYSIGFGVDDKGQWTDYLFDGGTGRFENVSGEFRLYGVFEYASQTTGTYSNSGSGTISY